MADSTIINGEDRTVEVEIEDKEANDFKVPALMQRITVLEQEKSELAHQNEVINERINKLKADIESSEIEKENLKSDTKALDSVAARAAGLETEVSRLQHDLISSMSESEQANAELVEIKREVEGLRKSESSKGLKLEAIEKERNLLLEKIKKDGEGVKESNSRIGELEKKIEALEARDGNYKSEKARVEEEMRVKIEEKEGQIRNLKIMVEELEAVIERSNKEREGLEIVKNELEALLKKSERKGKEMESKMEVVLKELEGSERMIDGLKEIAVEGINGNDVVMDRGSVGGEEEGFPSLKIHWSVFAASFCAGAIVAHVILRMRQR